MPSAQPIPPTPRRRTITALIALAVILALVGPVFHDRVASAQPTEPPAPTNPPPPTEPPPPTQVPPTDPPPPPTEVPVTEIPPTEIPATEQPTETPTNTPDPFPSTPSVPPTNPPVQQQPQQPSGPVDAGEVEIDCSPRASQATPIANAEVWNLQTCTVPLVFGGVSSLDIRAISSDPGWRVILLDPDDASTPGMLNASNNRTVVDDLDGSAPEFLLGTQRTCSALGSTTLTFELRGTQGNGSVEATGTFAIEAPVVTEISVDLLAASIDTSGETARGAFTVAWQRSDAPICPWQVTLTLPGASGVTQEHLSGPTGITAVTIAGTVIITVPADARTGEFRLEVSFPESPPIAAGVEAQVRP